MEFTFNLQRFAGAFDTDLLPGLENYLGSAPQYIPGATDTDFAALGGFRPVFGNALSLEQAAAMAPPAATSYLEDLAKQYQDAYNKEYGDSLTKEVAAATTPEKLTGKEQYNLWLRGLLYPNHEYNDKLAAKASGQTATNATNTDSGTTDGMTAARAKNQLEMALQAQAMRPVARGAAVDYGQTAKNAELSSLVRAALGLNAGRANEAARMATINANPLINGTAR